MVIPCHLRLPEEGARLDVLPQYLAHVRIPHTHGVIHARDIVSLSRTTFECPPLLR